MNAKSMKKAKTSTNGAMRKEYRRAQLDAGVRGKHHAAFVAGTNLVLLAPEIAEAFPTSKAVNAALRSLLSDQPAAKRVATRSSRR